MNLMRKAILKKCKIASLLSHSKSISYSVILNSSSDYQHFVKSELPSYISGDVHLIKDDENGIAQIVIDNPKAKNAVSGSIAAQLNNTIDELSEWKNGRAVVLYGANKQFCSGGDLRNFMNRLVTPADGGMMCKYMQTIMLKFARLPFINIALVQGNTLGGGAELAVACDFRLMQEDAVLGFVQAKMGLTTGFGGGANLVKLVGHQKAMEILMQCKLMDAHEALNIGLVNGIVPCDTNAVDWCVNWLRDGGYLKLDPELLQGIKNITKLAANHTKENEVLENERKIFETFWKGRLHKEALERKIKHR